jgi:hypothetical protein
MRRPCYREGGRNGGAHHCRCGGSRCGGRRGSSGGLATAASYYTAVRVSGSNELQPSQHDLLLSIFQCSAAAQRARRSICGDDARHGPSGGFSSAETTSTPAPLRSVAAARVRLLRFRQQLASPRSPPAVVQARCRAGAIRHLRRITSPSAAARQPTEAHLPQLRMVKALDPGRWPKGAPRS